MPVKKIIKKEDTKNPVHVQLETPTYLRKSVLKTAINATKLMQNAHEIKELRQQELILINNLRKTVTEIKSSYNSFEKSMPKIEREVEEPIHEKIHMNVQEDDELVKLKRELEHIENKLKEFD